MNENKNGLNDNKSKQISSLPAYYPDPQLFQFGFGCRFLVCRNYKKCVAITRLAAVLKFYSHADIINDQRDCNYFTELMNTIYHQQFLDDYHHLIKRHKDEIEEINEYFIREKSMINCSLPLCQYNSRHHRSKHNKQEINQFDRKLTKYTDTLDSLHFYIFHLFDFGLRSTKQQKQEITETDHEKKDTEQDNYYDKAFAKMNERVQATRNITSSFDRFKTDFSKFNISDDDNKSITKLDKMYEYLSTTNISSVDMEYLQQLVETEEFDTESIELDIEINETFGDPSKGFFHHKLHNLQDLDKMVDFFNGVNDRKAVSFNVGLRYYYWNFYNNKQLKELPATESYFWNHNDHSGYDVCDLYIDKKYKSFGEEIANYGLDKEIVSTQVYEIAKYYLQSKKVKAIVARCDNKHGDPQHYDTSNGAKLGFQNLVSLILYTDFTKLQNEFSKTFRQIPAFETLESVKKRNSKYWWWSKILRETVELYGHSVGEDDRFFTGISMMMKPPGFKIRLCGPTSTTMEIQVAAKFGDVNGMIFELKRPVGRLRYGLRAFDCTFISRYKEEEER